MFSIKQPFYLLVALFSLLVCAGSRADRAHNTIVAGTVSSIDPANSSFVVQEPGGRHGSGPTVTVDTTASTTFTELEGRQSNTVAFSALASGQQVSASGTEAAAGTLSATRVAILIPIVELAGTITSINSTALSFTVQPQNGSAITIDTGGSTKFFQGGPSAVPGTSTFAALTVGDLVQVSGTSSGSGIIAALQVLDSGPPIVHVSGTIASINSAALTFTVQPQQGSAVTVDTSAGTKFVTDSPSATPEAFTFADLAVGDVVQVTGTANGAGSVAAAQVTDLGQPVIHVSGTIASINSTALSFTVQPQHSSAVTVSTSAGTKFFKVGSSVAPAAPTFSDLAVGDAVQVTGTSNGAGSVVASQVTDLGPPIVSATGTVASLTSDGFILTVSSVRSTTSQVTVHSNSSTRFYLGLQAATLADVVVGAGVSLVGTENADGSVLASLVSIRPPKPVLEGTVANVSASAFTVTPVHGADVIVNVSTTTVYVAANGSAAQFSDVVAGAEVAVSGTVNSDGSVTATYVQIFASHSH